MDRVSLIQTIVAAGLSLLGTCTTGCSFFTPGWDLRQAAEARNFTQWTAENDLTLEESTTHTRKVIAAEGDRELTIEFGDDGDPKLFTGGAYVLQ